jgi:hypothetical protein
MSKGVHFLTYIVLTLILSTPKTSNIFNISKIDTAVFNKNIPRDSVQLVTPGVELFNLSNPSLNNEKREDVRTYITNILKISYPDLDFVEIPTMFEECLTVNKLLESEMEEKRRNAKSTVSVSNQLIVGKKKYSLLVFLNGRHTKSESDPFQGEERGVLNTLIINNFANTLVISNRYEYDYSPLKEKSIKTLILRSVKKIIK